MRRGAHHCAGGDDERAAPTVSRICAAREREGVSVRAGARAAAARAAADLRRAERGEHGGPSASSAL